MLLAKDKEQGQLGRYIEQVKIGKNERIMVLFSARKTDAFSCSPGSV